MIPPAVAAALAEVSGHVICVERCGAITARWDEQAGEIVLCHPYQDCPDVREPGSPAAVALAAWVLDELSARVLLTDDEPMPRNEFLAAP